MTTEDHSLQAFMAEPDPTSWGCWHLDGSGNNLEILDGATPRQVPLVRCRTDAGRWFWVQHYAGKSWITGDDVKDLVAALGQLAGDAA
jgi:hypothetical protein